MDKERRTFGARLGGLMQQIVRTCESGLWYVTLLGVLDFLPINCFLIVLDAVFLNP